MSSPHGMQPRAVDGQFFMMRLETKGRYLSHPSCIGICDLPTLLGQANAGISGTGISDVRKMDINVAIKGFEEPGPVWRVSKCLQFLREIYQVSNYRKSKGL